MDPVQSTPAIHNTFANLDVFKCKRYSRQYKIFLKFNGNIFPPAPVGVVITEKDRRVRILERKFNGSTIKNESKPDSKHDFKPDSKESKSPVDSLNAEETSVGNSSGSENGYLVPRQIEQDDTDHEVEMIMSKSLDSAEKLETNLSKRSKSEPTFTASEPQNNPTYKEKRRLFITIENTLYQNNDEDGPTSKRKTILIWLSVIALIFAIGVGLYFYS